MLFGFLLLLVVALADVGVFVGARWLLARGFGVQGRLGRLGIQFPAWVGVSFGRRALFTVAGPLAIHMVTILLFTTTTFVAGKSTPDEASMRVRSPMAAPLRPQGSSMAIGSCRSKSSPSPIGPR